MFGISYDILLETDEILVEWYCKLTERMFLRQFVGTVRGSKTLKQVAMSC